MMANRGLKLFGKVCDDSMTLPRKRLLLSPKTTAFVKGIHVKKDVSNA